jgi:hypothetical protein
VTDGPFAETKDLMAGWYIIDLKRSNTARRDRGGAVGGPRAGRRPYLRMARGQTVLWYADDRHRVTVGDSELRELVPHVLSVLVRRGADFATVEDAVQEALARAVAAWKEEVPSDPKAWLITVAWRVFIDLKRSNTARRDREVRFAAEPSDSVVPSVDDTLFRRSGGGQRKLSRRRLLLRGDGCVELARQ